MEAPEGINPIYPIPKSRGKRPEVELGQETMLKGTVWKEKSGESLWCLEPYYLYRCQESHQFFKN